MERKKIQINKNRNKKRVITIDIDEIQRILLRI
jgi:predicted secreted acid phosphatase